MSQHSADPAPTSALATVADAPRLVARRGDLPGLSAQLRRQQRRRHGRPGGRTFPTPVSARPRRGRRVAEPLLRLAAGRRRLRRGRLPGRRPHVRQPARRRRPDPRRPRAGPADHRRPRPQPLLRPARVVQAGARGGAGFAAARPLPLPARQGRERRTAAQRLGVHLRRPRLDAGHRAGRHPGRVVPAPLRARAARLQLGTPGRRRRVPLDPAVLARHGRRRLPHRRGARSGEGGRACRTWDPTTS